MPLLDKAPKTATHSGFHVKLYYIVRYLIKEAALANLTPETEARDRHDAGDPGGADIR